MRSLLCLVSQNLSDLLVHLRMQLDDLNIIRCFSVEEQLLENTSFNTKMLFSNVSRIM